MAEEKKDEKQPAASPEADKQADRPSADHSEGGKEETPQEEAKPEETKDESADEAEEVEVPQEFEKLVKEIEEMPVLQLSELVKVLEKKFGVSAAAPVAVAAAAPGEGGEEAAEEKSAFDIELTETGGNKIAVIKAVRAATELGLKDAKDMTDGAPIVVKEGVPKEEAEEIKKQLEEAGASVTLK